MVFKPAQNITEQIADYLAQQVIAGHLGGGARIQELKIANQLGVSRGSVREALLILERRHLIEIVPRKGAVVNHICSDEAQDLIDMLASIEHRWFHTLLARGDAKRICKEACGTVEEMEQGAKNGDRDATLAARNTFYQLLLGYSNRYIAAMFECLLPTSQRVIWQVLEHTDVDLHDIARYYKALLQSLLDKDGERLDELLTAFRKRLQRLTNDALAPVTANVSFRNGREPELAWTDTIRIRNASHA